MKNSQRVLLADNTCVLSLGDVIVPVEVGETLWVAPIRILNELSVDMVLGNDF
jgi:hypothetical protein